MQTTDNGRDLGERVAEPGDRAARSDQANSDIVIAGAALIACLGPDRRSVWEAIKAGRCGIGPLTAIPAPLPESVDGGQAVDLPEKDNSTGCREVRYLRRVLIDALGDAGLDRDAVTGRFQLPYAAERCATVLGTTLHGMPQGGVFLRSGDMQHLRTFLAAPVLRQAESRLGLEGPALSTCSACSSSLGAINLGITLLQSGTVDLVIAGGYDPITEYAYAGFNSLRLISPTLLRPFARDRTGMKVGEGYAVVVLERAADQRKRGGLVLARILGWGESADAHHLTQPHPQGRGAATAMKQALRSAQLSPQGIQLFSAHATGTPDNDSAEYAAMSHVFGEQLPNVPVVAFKSHLSHTLGAAGAVELILSAMAASEQIVPPCANVQANDTDFAGLHLAAGMARAAPIDATMNLSLGFGGSNTCVVLGRRSDAPPGSQTTNQRPAYISGISVLVPGGIGNAAFLRRLEESDLPIMADVTRIPDECFAPLASVRQVRRMSTYVKLSLAAAMLALKDADVADASEFCRDCSAILGTVHGAADYCTQYYRGIVEHGIAAANPMLFAEGVPNAAAAHLSLATGMTGFCQTIIGSRTAGLDALGLAAMRIASGQWERAIVVAADEYSPLVAAAYGACGAFASADRSAPLRTGWGAAAMVLESSDSLGRRDGAKSRGSVLKYAAGRAESDRLIAVADGVLRQLSDPAAVMSSANGAWLEQVEGGALRCSAERMGRSAKISSLGGYVAECFSAGPLAAIAAVLLGGKLPKPHGAAGAEAFQEPVENFASLATDHNGLIAGVSIKVNDREN
jgi:3-oxoacyl-[acyl-carrier-protein] synthase II